ncbi:MAG: Ig-like domain-containing protein [Clostridiaceae bacterium]|nr:Ig-like domain-containing protein [Clostridiaceae bacterium]
MDEEKTVVPEVTPEVQVPVADQQQAEKKICVKCGGEISDGQQFCPNCGQKVGERIETTSDKKAAGGKIVKLIAGCVIALVAIIVIIFFARGTQAKSVTLNKDSVAIKVGETATLTYTIDPDNTKDKTVTWSSSNESIAKVNNGIASGVNEGDCIITITTKNGKTDTCAVVITSAGPDLQKIYNDYCTSSFASIASDSSYLAVDTNPKDKDDYYIDNEAYSAIKSINEALGIPESVLNRMNRTRSLDGIQSYSTDEIEITWTYHPDKGLEVNYSLK